MRKLGGILVLGLLALTACSAPVEAAPQPLAGSAPSASALASETITAAPITAAPIQANTEAIESTMAPSEGVFGDPAADGPFLETVRAKWLGSVPGDSDLVAAAKFACEALANGATYETTGAVQQPEGDRPAQLNNAMLSAYASVHYCTTLAY